MGRPHRLTPPGGLHHVWAHENDGRPFFATDEDRRRLVLLLREAKQDRGLVVLAYCFMGNHFHLLLEDPRGELSRAMHRTNSCFARHRSVALGRPGVVFRSRFGSKLVQDDAYLATLVRYIARNPVRARLCGRPEQWAWSSHRALAHGLKDPLLDRGRLLERFEGDSSRERLERCLAVVSPADDLRETPPPWLPPRIARDARPSIEHLRQELGAVDAARTAVAYRYSQTEVAAALGVTRHQLRTWL